MPASYSNSENSKKGYHAIFFFSSALSWALTNLVYVILDRRIATLDYKIVLVWSGVLTLALWISFVLFSAYKIGSKKPIIFPLLAATYLGLFFLLIAKRIFPDYDIDNLFLGIALLIGFISGLAYSLMNRRLRLTGMLHKRRLFKTVFTITPDILLIIFFCWSLSHFFSGNVNSWLPYKTEEKKLLRTLSEFKPGDSYEQLKTALPDYFQENNQGDFVSNYEGPLFNYHLEIKKGMITQLSLELYKLWSNR